MVINTSSGVVPVGGQYHDKCSLTGYVSIYRDGTVVKVMSVPGSITFMVSKIGVNAVLACMVIIVSGVYVCVKLHVVNSYCW